MISFTVASAVLDASAARTRAALVSLAEAGWGVVTGERFEMVAQARGFLRGLSKDSATDPELVLRRAARAVLGDVASVDQLAVVRAGKRHGHYEIATRVARAAWRTATTDVDLDWCRRLAEHGEDAAIAGRDPETFVELLDLSARTYSAASDWAGAERAWLRALAVVDELGDTARCAHFLELVAANYRAWHRPHKAADTVLELVSLREREGDAAKTAVALAAVGDIMFDAGRFDAAVHYLGQADRLLRELADEDDAARAQHADVLGDLGRAHAHRGAINTARTCYHQALAKVLDTDSETTQRIRSLQAALPPTSP